MLDRLLFILLFGITTSALASDPAVRISESFSETSLEEVFNLLKKKYRLKLAYSERLIKTHRVSANIENADIVSTFDQLFASLPLDFEFIPPQAVIIKKGVPKEESYSVIGEILDVETGERLPFAYLFVEPVNKAVSSNEDGLFSLNDLRGDLVVRTSYLGYRDTTLALSKEQRNKRLIIPLRRSANTLEEIIVSDQTTETFSPSESIGTVSINPQFASQVPQAAEPDVFRMMQLLPGVNSTNELSSGLFINGGTANQNMVVFDGIPIYHVDHFFGYFSAINPYAIKSMRLFKGGFDARYGGRSSSIVEFTGKDGNTEEVSGKVSFNLLSANSSIEVPVSDNTTVFLSARRSYTDILSTSLFENIFDLYETQFNTEDSELKIDEYALSPEFYYTDLNFKISTLLDLKNRVSFSFYDSNDILNYNEQYDAELPEDTMVNVENVGFINWGNIGTSLKWSTLWNARHYTNFLLSYSYYTSEFEELSSQTASIRGQDDVVTNIDTDQDNSIKDLTLKADHEWTIGLNRLEFGVSSSVFQTRINSLLDDSVITFKEQKNTWLFTQYFQDHISFNKQTDLTLGLRGNYLSTTEQFYLEPRLSLNHRFNDLYGFSAATGIYRQFVNQINTENALEGSRDLWLLADFEIPDQRAIHFMAGFSRFGRSSLLSANFFYKDFNGLLDYAFREGGLVTEYSNYQDLFFTGKGFSRGLEIMAKNTWNGLTAWASYTLSETIYQFDDLNMGDPFYADHDQQHELNLFGSYQLGNFELYSTWYYGSGRPYSDLIAVPPPNGQQMGREQILVDPNGKNSSRLPAYHRLDVGVNYFIGLGNSDLRLSAKVFNLYNRENIYDLRAEVIPNLREPRANDDRGSGGPGGPDGPLLPKPGPNNDQVVTNEIRLMGITPSFSVQLSF